MGAGVRASAYATYIALVCKFVYACVCVSVVHTSEILHVCEHDARATYLEARGLHHAKHLHVDLLLVRTKKDAQREDVRGIMRTYERGCERM